MTIPLAQLTESTLPPPRYDASRCAAGAPGEQGCRACVDNCPYGAMQLLDQPGGRVVHIDSGMCARCGACTGLCPTSALERAFTPDEELLAAITEQAQRQSSSVLILTCADSAAWIGQSFIEEAPAIIEVPSILILNETHLIHALDQFDRLAIVGCNHCHHRSPALIGASIGRTRRLTGREDEVIYLEDDRSPDFEAQFRRLLSAERAHDALAQPGPEAAGAGLDAATHQVILTRRNRLRLLLDDRIDQQPQRTVDDPAFGQVELVDAAACTVCGACTRACPTEALRIDGGELSFSPVDCVNCQLCQQACPEKIVDVQPGLAIGPELIERRTLVADELIPCRSCGRPHMPQRLHNHVRQLLDAADGPLTASTEQIELCSACRDTGPDRTFHTSASSQVGSNAERSRPEPVGMPQIGRRRFLQGAATAALTIFGESALGQSKPSPGPSQATATRGKRLGMVIDVDRCIGCHACTAVCKAENHVPLGVFRDWVEEHVLGEYPHATPKFLPKLCNHCDDPGCLRACPTGAIHMRPDGIVDLNHDICIGCRACNQACPYGATFMDPVRGTADKCNFCAHRIDEGLNPACVDICPTGCRIFGDLEDPDSPASQAMRGRSYQELRPELGLGPKVKYLNLPGQLDR